MDPKMKKALEELRKISDYLLMKEMDEEEVPSFEQIFSPEEEPDVTSVEVIKATPIKPEEELSLEPSIPMDNDDEDDDEEKKKKKALSSEDIMAILGDI